MKKILKITLYTLVLFIIHISLCNALEYSSLSTKENTNITDYIGLKEGYITIDNSTKTTLKYYNYNNEELISKELPNLQNSSIIKQNDMFIVVGTESNMMTIYYLDKNLKVLEYNNTSYLFINTKYNLYTYEDNIYILPIKNNNINGINIYELNKEKELKENPLSSYTNIVDILKGDYFLIKNNMNIENNITYTYKKSTYKEDNYYLVGYKEDELLNSESVLSIYNKLNEKINEIPNEEYIKYIDVDIVNDNLIIIGEKQDNTYTLIICDLNGIVVNKLDIGTNPYENITLSRMNNNLIVISKINNLQDIYHYNYETIITKEEDIFGTLTYSGDIKPYNEIKVDVVPNLGYTLRTIIIKDDKGNLIPYQNGYFQMPTSNVKILVEYDSVVENPETADSIVYVTIIIGVMLIITIKLYKKFKWLQ